MPDEPDDSARLDRKGQFAQRPKALALVTPQRVPEAIDYRFGDGHCVGALMPDVEGFSEPIRLNRYFR
jgi:hypothetical protein